MSALPLLLAGCLAMPASMAAGQEPPPAELPSPSQERPWSAVPRPPETEVFIDLQNQWAGRLGFQGPLGAAASLTLYHGLGADVRDADGRVKVVCAAPLTVCGGGFLLEAAAGTGGGRLSVGLGARARVREEDFRGTVGVGLKASLAHTWGNPIGTEPGLTYLGPELDLSILRLELTLGVLWRVSGHGGASALFSWGVGFGI